MRTQSRCPTCRNPLRDLERVESRHTPATVPEEARGYSVTRSYTITECERWHRFEGSGGKGPLGWLTLLGSKVRGAWDA